MLSIGQAAVVTHVVDGDTIDVSINGAIYRVRLIGVDTSEISGVVECYGEEAAACTRSQLTGRTVTLEKDVSETDRYGRLVHYVWVGSELFNKTLVRRGYAVMSTYPPDVKYVERFTAAQAAARAEGAGLWGSCGEEPGSTPPPPPSTQPPAGACHWSYPAVCIPPPPPDLDCDDIPYRNFRVVPPDPHRFDGDRDGIGCEL